ncbi:MAG: hypothetical protein WEF86_08960 [Gemmatimonadota bacterium]
MFELLGIIAAGGASAIGYVRSRDFVQRRLRFVEAAQRPSTPLIAGAAATVIAAPVVAVLPIIGAGSALLFGIAVGAGTRAGARRVRRTLTPGY